METSSANFENIHDYSPGIVLLPACLKLKCVNVCFKKKLFPCLFANHNQQQWLNQLCHLGVGLSV